MLIRPLIMRELLRECRRGSYFLRRVAFLLILSGIVTFQWFRIQKMGAYISRQALTAATGGILFSIWAQAQFFVVCFSSMVRAASLADERRIGTLPLMRTTGIGDRGIIWGWFLSVIGRALFTMTLALPILFMSHSFGGFTINQALCIAVLTLVLAAEISALTLFLASRSSSGGAVVMVMSIIVLLWIIPVTGLVGSLNLSRLFRGIPTLNAGIMLVSYLQKGPSWSRLGDLSDPNSAQSFIFGIGGRLLMTLFLLRVASTSLGREPVRTTRKIKKILSGIGQFFLKMTGGSLVIWRPKLGVCKGNPILWRERAVSILSRPDHVIRLAYLSVILLILVTVPVGMAMHGDFALRFLFAGLLIIPCFMMFAATVVPPATAFAKEYQQKTLPILAVTPLTAGQIIRGKYGFAMRRMIFPLLIMGGIALLMWYSSYGEEEESITFILCGMALVPLAVAMVLFVCAGTESSGKAIVAAMALLGLSVFPLVLGLDGELRGIVSNHALERSPPLVAFFLAFGALSNRRRWMGRPLFLIFVGGVIALLTFIIAQIVDWRADGPTTAIMALIVYLTMFAAGRFSRVGRWAYVFLVPFVMGIAFVNARFAWFVLNASFLLGMIFLIRRAPKGVIARGMFAVAMVTVMTLLAVQIGGEALGYRYYRQIAFAVIHGVLALGLTFAFLRATTLQLDELMGRNG